MRTTSYAFICLPFLIATAGAVMRRALTLANISEKAAALDMGMDQAQASRQLGGQEHLHLDRWLTVPDLAPWVTVACALELGWPLVLVQAMDRGRMARMTLGHSGLRREAV